MHTPKLASPFRSVALVSLLAAGLFSTTACQKQTPPGAIAGDDVDLALETLAAAPTHGFAPGAFNEQKLQDLSKSDRKADKQTRDRLLYAALVAYGRAQHGLSIPKGEFPHDWGVRPAEYNADATLKQAVKDHKFKEWLAEQPPETPMYQALQNAYVAYLKVSAAGGWTAIPTGAKLKPGATGPAVVALRQRLAVEDPAVAQVDPNAPYDAALGQAVARFQTSLGLKPTGVVDTPTLKELNIPVITRAAQIRANLERLRWLPREEPATRVDVNTAAATMVYWKEGKPAVAMLSASGRPGDETPMLTSKISSIVLNPPWRVPQGIAQEELMPKGPDYLASHNFVTDENGNLMQQPGPDSALGLVKFDFQNPYAVYLHDTPSKAAFNQTQRAVSHGCVRLSQAVPFAKLILSQEQGWSEAKVDEVLATRETTTVKLSHSIPVRLLYLTAFPEAGRIAFRPDVYAWDGELLRLLDANTGGKSVAMNRSKRAQG